MTPATGATPRHSGGGSHVNRARSRDDAAAGAGVTTAPDGPGEDSNVKAPQAPSVTTGAAGAVSVHDGPSP